MFRNTHRWDDSSGDKTIGGKLLPHSDLRVGVFLRESSCNIQRGMKIGTWNVRSLYRAGSLKAAARELGRYKLNKDESD